MKFTDYKYEHMDIEALQAQLKAICSKLQNAASYAEFKNAFIELNDVNKYNSALHEVITTTKKKVNTYIITTSLNEDMEKIAEEFSIDKGTISNDG